MGVYIPNMDKPKFCDDCFVPLSKCEYFAKDGIDHCPLIDIVTCGECEKVNTKRCPMYSAGWGYTDDDWCSCGERRADEKTL